MFSLTLARIIDDFKNKKLDKSTTIQYLKCFLENSEDGMVRLEVIKSLVSTDSKSDEIFEILENLLISDKNDRIRGKVAEVIISNFPDKAYKPLKWILENETHGFCVCSILSALDGVSNNNLKTLQDLVEHIIYKGEIYFPHNGELHLSNKGISDISEIKRLGILKNLTGLYLQCNQISEIKGLYTLTKLEILVLFQNKIKEIKGLDKLTKLRKLDLQTNKIDEIKGINELKNLEFFSLSNNNITEIKGLESLKKLKKLNLRNNRITEIKGLDGLTNLNSLILIGNKISEIKGLDKLVNLMELSLDHNKITDIKGLEKLIKLKALFLSSNDISEFKGLENLTNLEWLNLNANDFSQINEYEIFSKIKHVIPPKFKLQHII